MLPPSFYRDDSDGHSWMWDGLEHVDPINVANALAARLTNGVTSLAEECAREGRDYHNVLRQRKREMDECERLGLPILPWMYSQQAYLAPATDDEKPDQRIKE